MQIKKSREVELERKKPTLFLLGLALACAIVLSAFEWRTYQEKTKDSCYLPEEVPVFEATIIPISFSKKEKPAKKKTDVKKEMVKIIIDEFRLSETEFPTEEYEFPDLESDPITEDISALTEEVVEEKVWPIADVMPAFPGGDSARVAFLKNQVRYPQIARDAGISGRVYVGFTVRKDGSITDIVLKRRVGGGLDEEAIRAVKAMPKWEPGFNNGLPVSVSFVMPVTFSLR